MGTRNLKKRKKEKRKKKEKRERERKGKKEEGIEFLFITNKTGQTEIGSVRYFGKSHSVASAEMAG
jgi:hypothetical protein